MSVRLRKRGATYWAEVNVEGKQRRFSLETRDPDEAQERIDKIDAELRADWRPPGISDAPTLAYSRDWLRRQANRLERSTLTGYRTGINNAIAFLGEARSMDEISREDVAKLLAEITRKKPLSRRTLESQMSGLRAMFNDAIDAGLITDNPFARTARLVEGYATKPAFNPDTDDDGEEVVPFSRAEQERLLAKADEQDRIAILIALRTGLRRSEVLALRWKDVDLDGRYLWVRQRLSRGQIGPPKTQRSRRKVPLSRDLAQTLREWKLRCPSWQVVLPPRARGPRGKSGYQAENRFADRFAGYLREARVPARTRIPFHRCRHTFATELLALGEPLVNVSRWLGHSHAAFTLRVYGHLIPERDEHSSMDRLEAGQFQDNSSTEPSSG